MAKNKRILIVEDEKPMAHALEVKLTHSGFDAVAVFNGEDALKKLESEDFDLMLLDLMMPVMDGFSVLEKLKEKKSKVPIIVTSNLSQHEDEAKARALGAKGYLIKSNTPLATIVKSVHDFLD